MNTQRDYQRQKFYDFERAMIRQCLPAQLEDGMQFEEARELVNRICASYEIRPPLVKKGRGSRAYYTCGKHTITLPPWSQRVNVVLHETAHAVAESKTMLSAMHGPFFVRVWMEMFSRMYEADIKVLMLNAQRMGVDYEKENVIERDNRRHAVA